MHHVLALMLLVGLGTGASAFELGVTPADNHVSFKSSDHVLANPASDREGGETTATATPILGLPYVDTGATCDNVHDYDVECPYTGSTAPDVVYSFTPGEDLNIDADLCGSLYDTKIYIYDSSYSVVACNDDAYFGDPCGVYVSAVEDVPLTGGQTYYIVIDGYGSDCGEYSLEVREAFPCVLQCNGDIEGEPPLMDGYQDAWNGGCNSPQFGEPFQVIGGYCGIPDPLILCGKSGWFDDGNRDTDWFMVFAGNQGHFDWEVDAEQETYIFELGPQDCGSVDVLQSLVVGPCQPGTMTVFANPGEPVWLWVGPTSFSPPDGFVGHEYDYISIWEGLWTFGVTPTEQATWGRVKSLFR